MNPMELCVVLMEADGSIRWNAIDVKGRERERGERGE